MTHIFDGVSEPLQKAKTSCETRDDGLKLYAREWLTVCPDRTADCDRSPEEAFKLPGGDRDDKSDLDSGALQLSSKISPMASLSKFSLIEEQSSVCPAATRVEIERRL